MINFIKKFVYGIIITFFITSSTQGQNVASGSAVNSENEQSKEVGIINNYHRALVLAREGNNKSAFNLLNEEISQPFIALDILVDYVLIAVWAEEYAEAINIYETRIAPLQESVPDYLYDNVAQAYYRLNKFEQALTIYHKLVATGKVEALQWEAECLTQLGKIPEALLKYEELNLRQAVGSKFYVSRALTYIKSNNPVKAMQDCQLALKAALSEENSLERSLEIRAIVSGSFIRNGDYSQAIILLKPAIEAKNSTLFMECDYIFALSANGENIRAITVAEMLWRSDLTRVPIYGKRALADAYLRTKKFPKAIKIYKDLINAGDYRASDQQSLAYASLLVHKYKQGIDIYDDLLLSGVERASIIAYDAEALLASGHYHTGQQLFSLILNRYPDYALLRQRFADQLSAVGMFREAGKQYQELSSYPDGKLAAARGLTYVATNVGDYHLANQSRLWLENHFRQEPETAQANNIYSNRRRGELQVQFVQGSDYKGNDTRQLQFNLEQRIGERMLLLSESSTVRVADNAGHYSLSTNSLGVRYNDMQRTIDLWLSVDSESILSPGYRLRYVHYFGEHSSLQFSRSKLPVLDVQALEQGINYTDNSIYWSRQLGDKDNYNIGLGKSLYSDGNSTISYDFYWDHKMREDDKKHINWFVYTGTTKFDKQTINGSPTVYESPKQREAYGFGLRHRWQQPKTYWEGTVVAEWGRDRPEPMDFSPNIRLEYGCQLSKLSDLVIGAEYGGNTGRSRGLGRELHFGYRQYDLTYYLRW